MSGWLDRLGRRAARHHWWFIGTWLVAAIVIVGLAGTLDGKESDNFRVPGAQSQTAIDLLEDDFPAQSGGSATVVFATDASTDGGIDDASVQPAIAESITALQQIPDVTTVSDPYGPLGPAITSKDGDIALVTVQYSVPAQSVPKTAYDDLVAATAPATAAGVNVQYGGAVVDATHQPPSSNADLVGIVAAVFILLLALGSVVAMGLPILTALFGLGIGLSLISVIAALVEVGTLAPILATMIGLGVGIDYALFIVTRFRENLDAGMEVEAAVGHAVATAGSAVLFAGTTVVIAICGLVVAGIPYVATLGYMAAVVVAVMMLAAVTLLPAVLGKIGHHVNSLSIPHFGRKHATEAATGAAGAAPVEDHTKTIWGRWASMVGRHAWVFAIASVAILLTLAWPVLSMRLGESDDGNLPTTTTQRLAYDLVAQGFGPGANGPLLVVVTLPQDDAAGATTGLTNSDETTLATLESALRSTDGVAAVLPPDPNPAGDVALITVYPTTAPDSAATEELVARLRSEVPQTLEGTGAVAYVGGLTATFIDIGDQISDRLPYFIGAVVLLSFLLLMLVFHSVLIPLTAAVMNLLSVAAAYGAIVAVFQWGWFGELIGLDGTVPIVAFVPMMMFAVLFGLSMDYQVFLLTRIREEYDACGETRRAVVLGLSRTARVITSAALIMICVFGAFVTDVQPEVKMFGLGLAFAVFIDATVVRMMLVPSIMEILGDANWWMPKWLDRILPRIDLEAPPTTTSGAAAATDGASPSLAFAALAEPTPPGTARTSGTTTAPGAPTDPLEVR